MRLFHGVASISGIKFDKQGIKVTSISAHNLRGKKVKLPLKFHKLILKKMNKWVNEWGTTHYLSYCGAPNLVRKVDTAMFTIGLNDDYMTLSLQHPSDVPRKKKGFKIATGRLKKVTEGKDYTNKYGVLPDWLLVKDIAVVYVE